MLPGLSACPAPPLLQVTPLAGLLLVLAAIMPAGLGAMFGYLAAEKVQNNELKLWRMNVSGVSKIAKKKAKNVATSEKTMTQTSFKVFE